MNPVTRLYRKGIQPVIKCTTEEARAAMIAAIKRDGENRMQGRRAKAVETVNNSGGDNVLAKTRP